MADSKVSIDVVGKDRASGAFKSASRALDNLGKKVSGIPIIGGRASQALSGLAASIGPQAIAAGAGAGLAALAAGVTVAVNKFTELAAEVLRFKRVSGLSAEDSSRFVAALDDMGISAETGATALFRLGRSTEQLAALGVQEGEDLKESFLNVADALEQTSSAGKRNEIVMTAFGRRGMELLPILERGREGIEEMFASLEGGQLLSDEDLQNAEDFRLALDALNDAASDLALEVGGNTVPALTELALGFSALVEQGNEFTRSGIGRDLGRMTAQAIEFSHPLGLLARHIRKTGEELLPGAIAAQRWKQEVQDAAEAAKQAATATDELREATEKHADAIESASDAETSLAKAQSDLNRLLEEGAVDEEQVASARERLTSATDRVTDSQKRLADATEHLNDVLSGVAAEDYAIQLEKANKRVEAAIRRANAVREAGGSVIAIEEADLEVREALNDVARVETDRADEIEGAREGVADSQRDVADANKDAKKAGDDLRRAEAGDPEFANRLAEARERVSDAERALEKAHYAVRAALEAERAKLEELRLKRQEIIDQAPGFFGAIAGPIDDFAGGGSFFSDIDKRYSSSSTPSTTSTTTINVTTQATDPVAVADAIARDVRMHNLVGQ